MQCKHLIELSDSTIRCSLIHDRFGVTHLPAVGRPNNPCAQCIPDTNDLPPAIIQRYAANYDRPSRGLGDTVAKVLHAVGIKQTPGCGCAERQQALNELVPYAK